ncbi:MAG: aldehyde dehydrogenase family protein [Dehalococcoidales bacterium]
MVGSATGDTFPTFNPATGEVIAQIPLAGQQDIDNAVAAAREAYESWSRLRQAERSNYVMKIGAAIKENIDDLAKLETLEHGTPVSDTSGALNAAAGDMEYAASAARSLMGDYIPALPNILTYLRREPVGVCALITPWNHALGMMAVKLGQALATGNTAIIKPPSVNSLIGLRFAELLNTIGLPPGVVNVITGPGSTVGEALVSHPGVDVIGFTGSSETGKALMAAGSRTLKKLIMELGGNNPVIVLEDADVDEAVKYHAPRQYHNAGQHCSGAGRYYVHAEVYEKFVEKYIALSKDVVVGDPSDVKTFLGPVASKEHRDRLENYIKSGVEEGARLVLGGKRPTTPPLDKGFFIMPTVFTHVKEEMKIGREETFGPIAVIMEPFTSEDEIIKKANNTRYGLCATVWTKDVPKGLRFVDRLHTGTVNINTQVLTSELPWGGFKESGFGKEGSMEGLLGYTQLKMVCLKYA